MVRLLIEEHSHSEVFSMFLQVISDRVLINIMESLRHLQVLALCYCLGEITPLS